MRQGDSRPFRAAAPARSVFFVLRVYFFSRLCLIERGVRTSESALALFMCLSLRF